MYNAWGLMYIRFKMNEYGLNIFILKGSAVLTKGTWSRAMSGRLYSFKVLGFQNSAMCKMYRAEHLTLQYLSVEANFSFKSISLVTIVINNRSLMNFIYLF